MEEPPLSDILIILFLILLGGFFSLMESAMLSCRKSKLRAKAEGGNRNALKALEGLENPPAFTSVTRLWIRFLEIFAGVFGGLSLTPFLAAKIWHGGIYYYAHILAAAIVVAAITVLAVILGEMIPRQIALAYPEGIFSALFPLLKILVLIGSPVTFILSKISGFICRLFRIDASANSSITEDELKIALIEGERSGIVESEERTMVEGVFYLGDRPVGTFMTHRSEIEWLDISASSEEAKSFVLQHPGRRYFPAADGSLDEVAGVVSSQDILISIMEGQWRGLKAIMSPPHFVPETMSALKAFEAFKREEADYLFVMDEYGGFAGTISVRNLIEEIVGELSTPGQGEEEIIKLEDGSYLVDGNVNIDDIAKLLSVEELLGEHQEFHTLAGLILEISGEIPRTGDNFDWNAYRFKVVDMDGNRI
ncbi:hemolysin family protein, partial [Treponema sp. OttesenSCG-928-L16]|nr:hemolysin family protein [Treponema sp. OttesenSCG-928-L16]